MMKHIGNRDVKGFARQFYGENGTLLKLDAIRRSLRSHEA